MTNPPNRTWEGADAYEAFMGRWSRPLAREFLDWLQSPPSAHWLEVGCGTGALTSAICELGQPASVLACDPSASFVEHARSRLSDARASFVVTGAEDLPRREGGFDLVVSGLVLNFLPDPARFAASFRERLRPGGSFAAYVWDYRDGMEFLKAFWEEAVALDPSATAHTVGLGFAICRPEALAGLLETAGFSGVQFGSIEIPTDFADFDDCWLPFLGGTGTGPSYATSLDAPSRERLKERLQGRLRPGADGRIRLKARAWAVRGRAS